MLRDPDKEVSHHIYSSFLKIHFVHPAGKRANNSSLTSNIHVVLRSIGNINARPGNFHRVAVVTAAVNPQKLIAVGIRCIQATDRAITPSSATVQSRFRSLQCRRHTVYSQGIIGVAQLGHIAVSASLHHVHDNVLGIKLRGIPYPIGAIVVLCRTVDSVYRLSLYSC